jgi:hypothetical protein
MLIDWYVLGKDIPIVHRIVRSYTEEPKGRNKNKTIEYAAFLSLSSSIILISV